ncbi:hypothetical protein [Dietzia cinnamea]|uniref:Uncharacterized protein n=1 Tax=Dietzia cinnamea TaxID=321318 RepID=A0A4R3ZV32_9ACTN|nr:hypothetical protein [Dietzia cinnamea]TCW24387.1 hypothetical protein EDD19_10784 [Dietzia cinnamea]
MVPGRTEAGYRTHVFGLLGYGLSEHREHFRDWLLSTHGDPENFEPDALHAHRDFISGPIGRTSFVRHRVAHCDPRHAREITIV